ncbi:MAG: preprotein translocase subunit SecE [Coriobacteriaceae bacterium]|nr:preprotein translocase subunit SecE [Coriobacteriaceae bacterium]
MAQKNNNSKKTEKKGKNGRAAKPSLLTRIKTYLNGVKSEMKRVVWPTKKELLNASLIVIGALVFFGVFVAVIDNIVLIPLEALASLGK